MKQFVENLFVLMVFFDVAKVPTYPSLYEHQSFLGNVSLEFLDRFLKRCN